MRRISIFLFATLAVAAASASSAAHATHMAFTSVGIEGRVPISSTAQTATFKLGTAECEELLDEELVFVWNITHLLPFRTDLDQRVLATTATTQSCSFEGETTCTELYGRTHVDQVQQIKHTFTLGQLFPEGCTGSGTRKLILYLKDNTGVTTGIGGATVEEPIHGDIEFRYDFEPPPAPASAPTVETGDQGLIVNWSAAAADAGTTTKYRVHWSLNPARLTGFAKCQNNHVTDCRSSDIQTSTTFRVPNLTNGTLVYVAYSVLDDYDNEGPVSPVASGTPAKISDFFEYYGSQGGQEKGGFCFIATAAYGSYWHPMVGSLRHFRDRVLLRSELGRDLVSFYYSWSPAMAEVIDDTPWLRFFFKVTLAPVAVAAWFLVDTAWWEKLLLLALAFFAWRALRRGLSVLRASLRAGGLRHKRALLLALLAVGLVAATAPAAFADSPRNFFIELKVGTLAPRMDNAAGVTLTQPFNRVFGDSGRVVSGLELEWQILKDVGSFGVSGAMLFFQAVGKGVLSASGETSPETTVLNVLPFQLNAVYRFDIPMRKYNVPLVPYAKAGIDWYLWWVLNGAGNVSSFTDGAGNKRRGVGGTFGVHFSLGLQFQLDIIDRRMQKSFDEEVGVNHSYLFAEIVFSKVDDFNDRGFNFGSTYFLAGLALEF